MLWRANKLMQYIELKSEFRFTQLFVDNKLFCYIDVHSHWLVNDSIQAVNGFASIMFGVYGLASMKIVEV